MLQNTPRSTGNPTSTRTALALAAACMAALAMTARPSRADTVIPAGTNIVNQVWTPAGSPYRLQGSVTVPLGASLSIEPGASVIFASNSYVISVAGELAAVGTTAQPVTLTTGGILVDTTATSVQLSHVRITGASRAIIYKASSALFTTNDVTIVNASSSGVVVQSGAVTLNDVTIRSTTSFTYGLQVDAGTVDVEHCTISTLGTSIYANGTSVVSVRNSIATGAILRASQAAVSLSYTNVFRSSNIPSGATVGPGIIQGNPILSSLESRLTSNSPGRFGAHDGSDLGALPYLGDPTPGLYGKLWSSTTVTASATVQGDLTVASGVTLTIASGVTLTFASTDVMESGDVLSRAELRVEGQLVVLGPATLTGSTLGSWAGLFMLPTASGADVRNLTINNASTGLTMRSGATTLVRLAVTNATGAAVRVESGAPVLDAFTIRNSGSGFLVVGGAPRIANAVVHSISNDGVLVQASTGAVSADVVNSTIHGALTAVRVDAVAGASADVSIANSIISSNVTGLSRGTSGGATSLGFANSDIWGNSTDYVAVTPGPGVISADPLYVSVTSFQLRPGSPCIDTGSAAGAPVADNLGVSRPRDGDRMSGAEFDMGAYEYVIPVVCGDGFVDGAEQCDDGAANGSYAHCNATCTAPGPYCGDGTTNGPEACDSGAANGSYGNCNLLCNAFGPRCGDGVVNGPETCDDGAGNGMYGGVCDVACAGVPPYCGDGVTNGPEACDSGAANGSYGFCAAACDALGPYCGDGVTNGPEACDSGSTNGAYGSCDSSCASMGPYCGDGAVNGPEQCDIGASNGEYGASCGSTCSGRAPWCGDGIRNGPEVCDQGPLNGQYSRCDATCSGVAEHCGDGVVNGPEVCDSGADNGHYGSCNTTCTGLGAHCGDGVVYGPETCDDGALNGMYGRCDSACAAIATCGDGVLNGPEECDDGLANGSPDGACLADCTAVVTPPEPMADAGCGCQSTDAPGGASLSLAGVVVVALRRRRRRRGGGAASPRGSR
ncbi:MAG: hypothetical protein IPL61_06940 [Myxococcales bacterium]|nr:hypothetical protein [Myxococcales bacterium]